MSNKMILIVIVITALVIVLFVTQQTKQAQIRKETLEYQVSMIDAQTRAQESCNSSWVCATTGILSNVGDIAGGLFGGLFGDKDKKED